MKILVLGSNGFLGSELIHYFSKNNEVFGASLNSSNEEEKLDLLDRSAVDYFFKKINPDIVIDTVALSSSVLCEQNPRLCKMLTFQTAKNIAKVCKDINAKMVFISSSYVFDGEKGDYSEEDIPSPRGEYAKSKFLAEREVLKLNNSIVLRVDLMYGLYKGELRVGTRVIHREDIELGYPSQLRSPVFIKDLPQGIERLLNNNQRGIFHIAGKEKITMLDFLKKLVAIPENRVKLKIVDPSIFLFKSPKNSTLDSSRLAGCGFKATSLEESIKLIKKSL